MLGKEHLKRAFWVGPKFLMLNIPTFTRASCEAATYKGTHARIFIPWENWK